MENEGFQVTYLPVKTNGLVEMRELEAAIRPETSLVSIMAINNEIGVRQPIEEIGGLGYCYYSGTPQCGHPSNMDTFFSSNCGNSVQNYP